MRLRNIPAAAPAVEASDLCIKDAASHKGHWNEIFGNDHPIRIEIGMGKGRFIMDLAARNPDINYLGMERYESVLYRGLQKLKKIHCQTYAFCVKMRHFCRTFSKRRVRPHLS